jgi:hypothetical protein
MKSMMRTVPSSVSKSVSRISVSWRRELPASVVRRSEQCGEARAGVEAGEAAPVDRPVDADERARLQVADEGVVLDPRRHGVNPTYR